MTGAANREPFAAWLEALRAPVEAALDRLLPPESAPPARLHEAMRYAVLGGGKRIRPALAVLAGETFGGARAGLLPPAAALELIHAYSLVHDDLPALDDDDLRRGRPTVHRRYDEATAVLAGDALLTHGLTALANEPADASDAIRRRAVAMVGEAVGTSGMIGGQVEDLAAERDWPADPVTALERIHRGKTAALLTAALRLGGLHAGAGDEPDSRLAALGARLGLMFQVADDVIDVEGSAELTGKTAGKDAAARKLTYPALYGVEGSRRRLEELRAEALELVSGLPARRDLWRGAVEYLAARRA